MWGAQRASIRPNKSSKQLPAERSAQIVCFHLVHPSFHLFLMSYRSVANLQFFFQKFFRPWKPRSRLAMSRNPGTLAVHIKMADGYRLYRCSSTNCPSSFFRIYWAILTSGPPKIGLGEMSHCVGDSILSQVHEQVHECLRSVAANQQSKCRKYVASSIWIEVYWNQSTKGFIVSRFPHCLDLQRLGSWDCDFMWINPEVKCLMPSTLIIRNRNRGRMSWIGSFGEHGNTKSPFVDGKPKIPTCPEMKYPLVI